MFDFESLNARCRETHKTLGVSCRHGRDEAEKKVRGGLSFSQVMSIYRICGSASTLTPPSGFREEGYGLLYSAHTIS